MHALIERFSSELASVVPTEAIELAGVWSTSTRKTYEHPMQVGSGARPFVEVLDARWRGTLTCASPLAGFAFMVTARELFWVKSLPAAMNPAVEVCIHARAGYLPGRASFAASLHGATLPSVPFACTEDLIAGCTLGATATVTGRAHLVAEVNGAAFVVIALQRSALKVGRSRLWRIREALTSSFPADLRQYFGRGRTGVLGSNEAGAVD